MDLTMHMGYTTDSAVITDELVSMYHNEFLSNTQNNLKDLIDKRKVAFSVLFDSHLQKVLVSVVAVIWNSICSSGKIMVAGNGGSASQSQHFCSELMGRYKQNRMPIQAISLSSDMSLVTCIANDFGYERIFSRQIESLGNTQDVFIAFTTSGNSRNILEALIECKSRGITSVVFTGKKTNSLKDLADYVVETPLDDTAIIQEIQMQLIHMLCEIIEGSISENDIWDEVLKLGNQEYNCLVLDRDGIINHIKPNGYVKYPDEFNFREDFLSNIHAISRTYKYIFVVSNQKGVGKGVMSLEELEAIHAKMMEGITHAGGRIDKIYISTKANNDAIESKPNTGMADLIKSDFPSVEFPKTVVVGDSALDYLFADKLNCKFVYVRTR